MKETRYFFVPDAAASGELPEEEARHAIRVLRLAVGDELVLMDGKGCFHEAEISAISSHRCLYRILRSLPQERGWQGRIRICMAPTKMMERTEWMAEKATEIGMDELTFLECRRSERRTMKLERIRRIVVAAMKQSRKAWMPSLQGMTPFDELVADGRTGDKFICHCYDPADFGPDEEKPLLWDVLRRDVETTVLIGPEGDFSIDEVKLAMRHGFRSVSLGHSRLRTETAALAAVHIMQIRNQST